MSHIYGINYYGGRQEITIIVFFRLVIPVDLNRECAMDQKKRINPDKKELFLRGCINEVLKGSISQKQKKQGKSRDYSDASVFKSLDFIRFWIEFREKICYLLVVYREATTKANPEKSGDAKPRILKECVRTAGLPKVS